jgi:alpha-L-arabinofuranosidase
MRGDTNSLWGHPLHYERFYRQMQPMIWEFVPSRDIKLAVKKWNTSLPLPRPHSMGSALYAARLPNVFERTGDFVEMSAVSDMVNGWTGSIIQASRYAAFVTPTELVNMLYASRLGRERLSSDLLVPPFHSTPAGKAIPSVDAVGSRLADGAQIFITAVKTDPVRAIRTEMKLDGVHVRQQARIETLNDNKLTATNDFSHPEAAHITSNVLAARPVCTVSLPEHSLSVTTVEVD